MYKNVVIVLWFVQVSVIGGVPVMLKTSDMSNTIPDEKTVITYMTYLCARLLNIRNEQRAATVIQLAWRRYRAHHCLHVRTWLLKLDSFLLLINNYLIIQLTNLITIFCCILVMLIRFVGYLWLHCLLNCTILLSNAPVNTY